MCASCTNKVTFTVSSGPGLVWGTGNGDPASHVADKSPWRPAYHGLVLAVIAGGSTPGSVVVQASTPGLNPVTVAIQQLSQPAQFEAYWCHTNPTL